MRSLKIISILLLFVSNSYSSDLFEGKVLNYTVKNSNSVNIDSIEIRHISKFFLDKLKIKFDYKINDSTFNSFIRESSYTSDSDELAIQPPIGDYLDNTEFLPHPELTLPPKIGDSIYSEHRIPKHIKSSADIIKGYNKVVGMIDYKSEILNEMVWVIESKNILNNLYTLKFYFSEKYGIVYFEYKLKEDNVYIELVNFESYEEY